MLCCRCISRHLILHLLASWSSSTATTSVAPVASVAASNPDWTTLLGRSPQLVRLSGRQAESSEDSSTVNDDDDPVLPTSLPQVIGLVVPRSPSVRVGQNVTFGWLDVLPSNGGSTSLPGIFREVTPLVTFQNQTVIVLPTSGTLDMTPPFSPFYPPVYPEGWCSVQLATRMKETTSWVVKSGMEGLEVNLVLNVTWGLPTYTGTDRQTNCSTPARLFKSLFVSSPLSVLGLQPTAGSGTASLSSIATRLHPGASTSPLPVSTTLLALSTAIPPWPRSAPDRAGLPAKRALADLLAGFALACFAAVGTSWYLVRRRRQMGLQDYRPATAAAATGAVGDTLLLQPRWASPQGPLNVSPEYWSPPIDR